MTQNKVIDFWELAEACYFETPNPNKYSPSLQCSFFQNQTLKTHAHELPDHVRGRAFGVDAQFGIHLIDRLVEMPSDRLYIGDLCHLLSLLFHRARAPWIIMFCLSRSFIDS